MAWLCPACGAHWLPGPVIETVPGGGPGTWRLDPEVRTCPQCDPDFHAKVAASRKARGIEETPGDRATSGDLPPSGRVRRGADEAKAADEPDCREAGKSGWCMTHDGLLARCIEERAA